MQLGVVFPQTEIGADPGGVRAYAQAAEALGFRHLMAYEHVLGADRSVHAPWNRPYDLTSMFHEPMVLFGFLAGVSTLELVSGVVILPQRPAVLVAKQAAEVDVLCGGRLRFRGWSGCGLGCLRLRLDPCGGLRLRPRIGSWCGRRLVGLDGGRRAENQHLETSKRQNPLVFVRP